LIERLARPGISRQPPIPHNPREGDDFTQPFVLHRLDGVSLMRVFRSPDADGSCAGRATRDPHNQHRTVAAAPASQPTPHPPPDRTSLSAPASLIARARAHPPQRPARGRPGPGRSASGP